MNKRKIINDPVYGFIQIPNDLIYDLIEHPIFQRLRRIRQLGLSYLVYPGAQHTRFHHALGAMYLMNKALEVLKNKGVEISPAETEAALAAILLHDLGHGPFSHVLEHSILQGINHEQISLKLMRVLNEEFGGRLTMAIDVFTGAHPKNFLHELVSSQLDMDRLDYLSRDSFYTGVSEGIIGTERIIQMLNVANDQLVIDEKGVYSVEKFIVARRLMYWQVYLHKATLAADEVLLGILRRAKEIAKRDADLFSTPALGYFLHLEQKSDTLDGLTLDRYTEIDDTDIISSIKVWMNHGDFVLRYLSRSLINRKLPAIELSRDPINEERYAHIMETCAEHFGITAQDASYLVRHSEVRNEAYKENHERITIRSKNGTLTDIAEFSDNYNISALKEVVTRYYLCYPKEIEPDRAMRVKS